jgi:hypothetical protein
MALAATSQTAMAGLDACLGNSMNKKNETTELREALAKVDRVIAGRTYLGGKEVEMAFSLQAKAQHRLADAGALAREVNAFADAQLAQIEASRGSLTATYAAQAAEAEAEELRVKAARDRHRAEQEAIRQRQRDSVASAAVAEALG